MIVTLKQSAFFLFIVSLSPATNAILSFHYRFYNNNACNHDAPSEDTFPLNGLGPLLGSQNQCLSAPQNGNWTTVELDNSVDTGGLALITFCNINCEGAGSSEQSNARCFIAAPNCFIGSFSVSQTTSGSETSPSTLPPSTASPSLPTRQPISSSTQPSSSLSTHPSSTSSTQSLRSSSTELSIISSTQPSNTSNPMPSTLIVTQTPVGVGGSLTTQSSKAKISKGTVAGGAVGGVLAIAGLAFLLFFLLRRAKKRQVVSPYGIPTLSTPSHAATTTDETHPMSLTPIPIQATGKFVREHHNFRDSVVVSASDEHLLPLNSGPDTSQIHRHDDSGVRFSRTGGSMVQLPPLYTRG